MKLNKNKKAGQIWNLVYIFIIIILQCVNYHKDLCALSIWTHNSKHTTWFAKSLACPFRPPCVCRVVNKLYWYVNGYINPINSTHTSFFQSLSLLGVMQSRLAMCVSLCIIFIPFSVSPCVPDSWRSDGTTEEQRKHLGYLLRKQQPPTAMNLRWEPEEKRTPGRPNKTWQRVVLKRMKTAWIKSWNKVSSVWSHEADYPSPSQISNSFNHRRWGFSA